MSEAPPQPPLRAALAGRWQIPVFGVGLLVLGGGLIRIAAAHQPVTFEEELRRVSTLRQNGALLRANAYLLDLLKDVERPPEQRGEFHRLLASTVHQAEAPLAKHNRQNVRSIIRNFRLALRYGVTPGAGDWDRVGDAQGWSNNLAEAADSYRQALRLSPSRPDRIRRKLVELHLEDGHPPSAEVVADLDAILDDVSSSPGNYLWALEHKVAWLLEHGDAAGGLALVETGKARLAGTAQRIVLSYVEALCRCDSGARYSSEAERLLRSLLNNWRVHDGLWGKANWLLGRLEQVDDRPQAALSFYAEVMQSFQSGDLNDACTLGRAECLAALGRYERSLEVFAGLAGRLFEARRHPYVDRDAVRATVTAIAESLLQAGRVELGIEHLRFALTLVDPSDQQSQSHYLARIAAGLTELANALRSDPDAQLSPDPKGSAPREGPKRGRAAALFVQAAQTYLSQAGLQVLGGEDSARALELAADNFDAAGMTDRVIEMLERLARDHPTSQRRAAVLHRLGQVYQAVRRYPDAVAAYEEAMAEYPRLMAAHSSMVPMAECLIALGGEAAKRGAEILISIVDDQGDEHLFDPQAQEYRTALFGLAEYYGRATDQAVPEHFEKAVARLEDAIAFYPDDPQVTRLGFMLADAYRQSGRALREQDTTALSDEAVASLEKESDRRLEMALANFGQLIGTLAGHDASMLSELEQTYLRMSYLYRSDCLFDLGRYVEAVESYNETVWRYENLPAAVSASMQIVHCHQRLGQMDEARAGLERLAWLLRKIPASAFETERGMSSKAYWQNMVARLQRTGVY